mmetsp:Transcript_25324/g.38265  ORF Transcript_25324/g.38265 Transcript_25324/m.38265 type:complete len:500 (+) Transcript_25324:53-1552(+)
MIRFASLLPKVSVPRLSVIRKMLMSTQPEEWTGSDISDESDISNVYSHMINTKAPAVTPATGSDISNVLSHMINTGVLSNSRETVDPSLDHGPLKLAVMYDLDAVDYTIESLAKSFPDNFQHRFAMKSCPLSFFLRRIIKAGMGLECASLMEVKHALKLGCGPEKIIFDSPCKTDYEIAFALASGIGINADNLAELEIIVNQLKEDYPNTDPKSVIGVRINPLVGFGSNKYLSVSQATSKFGIPLTEKNRTKVIELFKEHSWLKALHCHVGSQGCGLEMLAEGASTIQDLADEIDAAVGNAQVTTLNIGGGLPVNFSGDSFSPTFGDYASVLQKNVPALLNGNRTILTEYGRSVCAKSSWTVSEVEYVKKSPEVRIGIIHAGSDIFLRACYLGDLFPHRLEVYNSEGAPSMEPHEPHNIAGPLCFGGDILGREVDIPAVHPGDYVVIKDTGSNTVSLFSRHCSRPAPAVYGYSRSSEGNIELELLKPQETEDDILKFWG